MPAPYGEALDLGPRRAGHVLLEQTGRSSPRRPQTSSSTPSGLSSWRGYHDRSTSSRHVRSDRQVWRPGLTRLQHGGQAHDPLARQESGPEKRRPVLRPFFAPQGRANPRVSVLSESSRGEVMFRSRFEDVRSSAGRRREPRLHILPAVSEVAANTMRARPLPLVSPHVQRPHRNLKVGRDIDWRGQTSGPSRRPSPLVSNAARHHADDGRPVQ